MARLVRPPRMATATYLVVKYLHVVASAVALGYVALLPMWRNAAARTNDAAILRHALEVIRSLQSRLAIPTLAIAVVTGLLLTVGPLATTYDLTRSRWAQGAAVVGTIFAILVVFGLSGPVKKMLPLVEKGESEGPAMDKLWSEWRTSLAAAALLGLVSVALMVYRPGV